MRQFANLLSMPYQSRRIALAISAVIFLSCFAVLGLAQSDPASTPEVSSESHHKLVFENGFVKVLHLHLAPGEVTERHQHTRPYIFVSLAPGKISNEVRGRTPKTSELEYGELRSSKGGFALAERNGGDAPLELVVVELQKEVAPTSRFTSEEADFKYHNVMVGHLLDGDGWRAYEMNIASEGYTEKHLEPYNRLMIAVSEVNLQMDVAEKERSLLHLQPGDVRWPRVERRFRR